MTTRRTVMSGLAFLVQPFAATASFLGNQFGGADLMKPLTTHKFICYAQFGNISNRPFSSASIPLLAGAPAAAASGGNRESSLASSSPRKSPRKSAPRRRKPKFANDYVETAAAADLLDLSHDDEINTTNNNNLALNSFEKSSEHNHSQQNHHEQSRLMDSADADTLNTAKESFPSKALVFEDDAHPIREHLISGAAWAVLLRLRSAGHETYIVGGTVRDMLLNNTPKDYDILTSAEPSEIEYLFPRAFVLGRSFPICHVHHDNEIIEVSSFSTNADPSRIPLDVAAMMTLTGREIRTSSSSSRRGSSKASDSSGNINSKRGGRRGGKLSSFPQEEEMYDEDDIENVENGDEALIASGSKLMKRGGPTWSTARRDNAIKRDFRVNGLLYDPFSRILYDYVGGTADCTARILRTMGSPIHSFSQDPARILRAVRLAARVELTIEKTTSEAMMSMAVATVKLPQGRLQMELAAMFTHGAALPAMKLLWRYGLLDMLLPHHAVMLSKQHVPRKQGDDREDERTSISSFSHSTLKESLNEFDANTVLFALLAELDKTTSSYKPAETAVWVTAIAAPLVAQECQRVVERRAAAKLRKQRREEQEDEEERGSSSSSSNEWYDVEEIDALLASKRRRNEIKTTKTSTATANATAPASSNGSKNDFVATDVLPSSPEYLEIYGRIVDKVMAKLLSKPDAKTQKHLARIAPFAVPLNSGGGVKRKKKPRQGVNGDSSSTTESNSTNSTTVPAVPVLSCVLPRQAVEAARSYLKLEALLRGQELDYSSAMNDKQGRGGGSAGGKKRSGAQQPRHVGRSKKGGRGRKLAANEYAVLQLLRAPSVQWVQATQLAISDEEEE